MVYDILKVLQLYDSWSVCRYTYGPRRMTGVRLHQPLSKCFSLGRSAVLKKLGRYEGIILIYPDNIGLCEDSDGKDGDDGDDDDDDDDWF